MWHPAHCHNNIVVARCNDKTLYADLLQWKTHTPVWVRLLGRCAETDCPFFVECVLRDLAERLHGSNAVAVHRAVTVDQQLQLATHQEKMAAQGLRIDQQSKQLAGQTDILAQQSRKINHLQRDLSAQKELVAEQAADIAGLQEQLSAQQQASAEQAAQIAHLHGQLSAQQRFVAQQAAQTAELLHAVRSLLPQQQRLW